LVRTTLKEGGPRPELREQLVWKPCTPESAIC